MVVSCLARQPKIPGPHVCVVPQWTLGCEEASAIDKIPIRFSAALGARHFMCFCFACTIH